MATEITNARLFYKDVNEALPTTGNIIGDVYVSSNGSVVVMEESFTVNGWVDRGIVNSAASVILPQNASGILSVDELLSLTTATPIIRSFPNGLTGLKMWFDQIGGLSSSKYCAVAFNNTAFNDVNVVGLRRLVRIGDEQVFTFKDNGAGTLPTEVTFLSSDDEGSLGDTVVYFEAVQKP